MVQIIPTCRAIVLAAAVAATAAPAAAARTDFDPARTYVEARAASMGGDHGKSARLLAQLAESGASTPTIARSAVSESISAGDFALALRLARRLAPEALPLEARLLLAAQEVRSGRNAAAAALLERSTKDVQLDFFAPFLAAWSAAEKGDADRAIASMSAIPSTSALAPARDEHLALILLKLKRAAQADPYARRAIAAAGGREQRLRFAFAEAFLELGDKARAEAMLAGLDFQSAPTRTLIENGRGRRLAIDSTADAFSELLLRLALDVNRLRNPGLAVAIAQVARHAAPDNDGATMILAVLLRMRERPDDALAVLATLPKDSPLTSPALDVRVRTLVDSDRGEEALALARKAAAAPGAHALDLARLGDTLAALDRHSEAAEAYRGAIARSTGLSGDKPWPLYLLRANALVEADRWPEAKSALQAALALAPDQPLILNFLGYSKLERGEDLDVAEAMIRKAAKLAPDNASITDSLGWALYKRGRVDEAIAILEEAAQADPAQTEIHEHLGDALYKVGRKYEARFSWRAALVTADEDVAERINRKIAGGLTAETAAP